MEKESVPLCEGLLSRLFNRRKLGEFVRRLMGCSLDHRMRPLMDKFYDSFKDTEKPPGVTAFTRSPILWI